MLLLFAISANAAPTHGEVPESIFKSATEVDFKLLRITPEDYDNKRVTYNGRFIGITAQFYEYMVKSGLRSDRYVAIGVGDLAIPIFVRKQGDIPEFLAGLKPGCTVQVYGRIRDFRHKPPAHLPRFYMELDHITVLEQAPDLGKALQDFGNKIRQSIEQKKQERIQQQKRQNPLPKRQPNRR